MTLTATFLFGAIATVALSIAVTQSLARYVEVKFPPAGHFRSVGGTRLHFLEENSDSDSSPVIFLHGAGGNARDLYSAMAGKLNGLGRAIFLDRPGSGYSDALPRPENASIERQADLVAGLMDELGLARAIIVGHSLGGAVALALALNHPGHVTSLVLAAPATHPWPGGRLSWYYRIARMPIAGWMFIETLTIPIGHLLYHPTVGQIFAPDPVPADYPDGSATRLILRPDNFRNNARDVAALYSNLQRLSKRYREIDIPVTIVTGDCDSVVAPQQHAFKLASELRKARLVTLADTGHMPLHVRPDLAADEIRRLVAQKKLFDNRLASPLT
jgi:pimeloyl-ACP methyl ester carboxylesterase